MRARIYAWIIPSLFCALFGASFAHADAGIGDDAPAFVAKTLDGKAFDLSAQKGKVVVLSFWATWCPPCRWEMPALEAVWRQYRTKDLVMLAVSADLPRVRGSVVDVMHYFSFPAAMMDSVTKNELLTIKTVPVTYVIGKNGKVEDIMSLPMRPLTAAELDAKVKALLDVKYEDKSDKKKEAKAQDKTETKPEDKTETKAGDKTETKAGDKTETKAETKADDKTEGASDKAAAPADESDKKQIPEETKPEADETKPDLKL